ncbi:MAG: hypothetical protein PHN88_08070 [Ignavibacteria bacterium]|nr:hypothetical protein [Ignavibacteria bacterium]
MIFIEKDSIMFEGYIVFHNVDSKLVYKRNEKNYVDFNFYFVKDLDDFENSKHRYYYSSEYYWYIIGNYPSDEPVIFSVKINGKDSIIDSSRELAASIAFFYSKEFQSFKKLYFKYYGSTDKESVSDVFLKKPILTQIFDNPKIHFMNYGNRDSTGYFIFKCSFPASVLKFKSYYVIGKDENDELIKVYPGYIRTLMPIGPLLYLKYDEKELTENGFKKSKWYPDYIFNKK